MSRKSLKSFLALLIIAAALSAYPRQTNAAVTSTLNYGDTGPQVTQLQQTLTNLGYYSGPTTEYFGRLTKSAVARFQAANNIFPATGYFGPKSLAKLNSLLGISNNNANATTAALSTSVVPKKSSCETLSAPVNAVIQNLTGNGPPEDPFVKAGVSGDPRVLFFLPAINTLPVRSMRLYFNIAEGEYRMALSSLARVLGDCRIHNDDLAAIDYQVALYHQSLMRINIQKGLSLSEQVMNVSYFAFYKAYVVDPSLDIVSALSGSSVSILADVVGPVFDGVFNYAVSPDTIITEAGSQFIKAEVSAVITAKLSGLSDKVINKQIGQSGIWDSLGSIISRDQVKKEIMSGLAKETDLVYNKALENYVDDLLNKAFSTRTVVVDATVPMPAANQAIQPVSAAAASSPPVQQSTVFSQPAAAATPTQTPSLPQLPLQSPSCTPNWQSGVWGTCSNGQQTRTVFDNNACGKTTNEPATTQPCFYKPPSPLVSQTLNVTVNNSQFTQGTQVSNTSFQANCSFCTAPYTWTISGLPPGMTSAGGMVSGAPTQAGLFTVKVIAIDSYGISSGGKLFSFTVASQMISSPTISISPTSGPPGTVFTVSGTNFTPNNSLMVHFEKPDTDQYANQHKIVQPAADSSGNLSYDWHSSEWQLPDSIKFGAISVWALDNSTGRKSPSVSIEITAQ